MTNTSYNAFIDNICTTFRQFFFDNFCSVWRDMSAFVLIFRNTEDMLARVQIIDVKSWELLEITDHDPELNSRTIV